MERISEKEAIRLLRKYASSEKDFKGVLAHSKAVQKAAVKIGKRVKGIDLGFIRSASLLHDIGRFKHFPGSRDAIRHGIEGAAILRKEGLPKHALVAERHLGAGISKKDIVEQGLNLPLKDYLPVSMEEKIITHADNLVFRDKIKSVKDAVKKFNEEVGERAGRKIQELADEVEGMENSQQM
ncbi:HDIG domain-containing protein [Candidatus Woesearchaeota archaeon]|nr:HDIG domain-containing protein [Candidatus Woesearchaeota archaeon]